MAFPNPRIPYAEIIMRLRRLKWGRLTSLRSISGFPIFLWEHSGRNPTHQILLSAGIHGNEPAGVECLLDLLERRPAWLNRLNLFVFPCLNPWGYEHNARGNDQGEDLNRRWKLRSQGGASEQSKAREVFLVQRALRGRRFDFTICLHEDYDATGFYIYEVVRGRSPGPDGRTRSDGQSRLGQEIVTAISRFMPIEKRKKIEGRRADRGVVVRLIETIRRRHHWPEALYHVVHHSELTLTSETPTHFPIKTRIRAHAEVIRVALKGLVEDSFSNAKLAEDPVEDIVGRTVKKLIPGLKAPF